MKFRRPSHQDIQALCGAIGPEDGLDPRYDRRLPEGRDIHRKTLQLCGQVARLLRELLADCGDEGLRNLELLAVQPAAGGGRLLVLLQPDTPVSTQVYQELQVKLSRAAGWLHTEVAGAIHRRRAPELVLQLLPRE